MAAFNVKRVPFDRERLTVTTTPAVSLTASKYEVSASPVGGNQTGALKRRATGAIVILTPESGPCNYSCVTTPTSGVAVSNVGNPVAANDVITLDSHEAVVNFKIIANSSTNAIIEVEYLR